MDQREVVIDIQHLSKTYYVKDDGPNTLRDRILHFGQSGKRRTIKALEDINIKVYKGEVFGVIGKNGSGKSTLLHCMMGIMRGDPGSVVHTKGKIIRLAMGMGFDPNLTGTENIYVNGSILGLTFSEIGDRYEEIVGFAGLEDYINVPVKAYSKGMQTRLKFSIAMHAKADIFLLDEFFGGTGDLEFKQKSQRVFEDSFLRENTVVVVSHNLNIIKNYCNRACWILHGKQMAIGDSQEVAEAYATYMNENM